MGIKSASIAWRGEGAEVSVREADRRWILAAMGRYGQALVGLLWRILGNEQDVCDAYQETFLRLAHCSAADGPTHVKAYLFRTAGNVAISILRRNKQHIKACQQLAGYVARPIEADCGGDLDAKELQATLRFYIAQLPEYLRNVILLHDLGELSYQQVGRLLGISAATARVYRCRAIQWLAARMADRKDKNEVNIP